MEQACKYPSWGTRNRVMIIFGTGLQAISSYCFWITTTKRVFLCAACCVKQVPWLLPNSFESPAAMLWILNHFPPLCSVSDLGDKSLLTRPSLQPSPCGAGAPSHTPNGLKRLHGHHKKPQGSTSAEVCRHMVNILHPYSDQKPAEQVLQILLNIIPRVTCLWNFWGVAFSCHPMAQKLRPNFWWLCNPWNTSKGFGKRGQKRRSLGWAIYSCFNL